MELKISPESIENLKIAINPNFKHTDENSKESPFEDKTDLTAFVKVRPLTADQKSDMLAYYRKLADSDGRIELKYSRMDGDFVITELLENSMHFDGHDYTDYLPEGFTPDYDGALEILNDVEVIE